MLFRSSRCLLRRRPLWPGRPISERFSCGHHVQHSGGAGSLSIDVPLQQAIQSELGIGRAPVPEHSAWLVHAALTDIEGRASAEANVRDAESELENAEQALREPCRPSAALRTWQRRESGSQRFARLAMTRRKGSID